VNHEWIWEDPSINSLLEQATRALGELNAFSLIVPDIDLFIEMHVVKEAQTSSKIEGTQTGMDEALMPEDQVKPEKRDDWREVRNYIDAVNTAVAELKSLPLSNRLLKQTHAILMQGVRGEHKQPANFRSSQNWIGGSSLADATFIPPHHEGVDELMGDLEKFWHNEQIVVPHLVRAAISHYQFETVHPFLDGNGRIGRLLIPLYFISHGLLAKPSLYLSDFFERNRASYYDALMQVRVSNNLIHWVRFFLNGVAQTATKGRDTFQQVLALRNQAEQQILQLGKRTPNARQALSVLYRKPMVTAADLERELGLSQPTVNALLRDFMKLGLLREVTGAVRNRLYVFESYLELFVR
jgi:Fic family protein